MSQFCLQSQTCVYFLVSQFKVIIVAHSRAAKFCAKGNFYSATKLGKLPVSSTPSPGEMPGYKATNGL